MEVQSLCRSAQARQLMIGSQVSSSSVDRSVLSNPSTFEWKLSPRLPEGVLHRRWSGRSRLSVTARINIDRRMHLERAFKRQLEAEQQRALMAVSCPLECVREVRNLADLEAELEAAEKAGELVVVDFYNSACGACKNMLPYLITLCKTGALDSCLVDLHEEAPSLDAVPARFLKHNVRDDYDDLTDIARLYRIKIVPTFAFFLDGSRIGQLVTRDSRRVADSLAKLVQERQQAQSERQ